MHNTTTLPSRQVLVWFLWFLVILVHHLCLAMPGETDVYRAGGSIREDKTVEMIGEVVSRQEQGEEPFPWVTKRRWRSWALKGYRAWQRAVRKARWAARIAWLATHGAVTMAMVVDWLTRSQLQRHLGALPVLYELLEILQVRQAINRRVPTQARVDHGTVALVLVLNRLSAPRPLYQVADWLARTVLVYAMGIPAEKFNDDRLGRTLEALAPHARDIWLDITQEAMLRFGIDLSILYYDLTAFVVHGEYKDSHLAAFGFAHNTPLNKRKIKAGLTVSSDGKVPCDYASWAGRTADTATVQTNLENLNRLLQRHRLATGQSVLLVGDRANLNDELALVYDRQPHVKYLAGLEARKTGHRELLRAPDGFFYRRPALAPGYWGWPCRVRFEHQGRHATHQGLVVLSGPMRSALRQSRAAHFRCLYQELRNIRQKIGQPHYRTVDSVRKRAQTCCRRSPVGKLMTIWTTEVDGQVQLHWVINRQSLLTKMVTDGRYLLVSNNFQLQPEEMFTIYRQKDGVEKCNLVCKKDLKVSPIYLHKDTRIQGMLFINMLALLTYSLLERQVRRQGFNLTLRQLIARLEDLTVFETHCRDGSVAYRLSLVDDEQSRLLVALADILDHLRQPRLIPTLPAHQASRLFLHPSPLPLLP
jgi:hypothetical protein